MTDLASRKVEALLVYLACTGRRHPREVLADMLQGGRLASKPGRKMVVTYRDPCDLGRKADICEAPRQVLQAIPGVTFVEMDSRRETALCCSGGGNLETFDTDLGAEAAAKRIIAPACPQCERTMSNRITGGSATVLAWASMMIEDRTARAGV